jgi:hypothetical protein
VLAQSTALLLVLACRSYARRAVSRLP